MVNGGIITVLRVPPIVATLGTLSIYRGIDFFVAGGHEVNLADLPPGYSNAATDTILGIPMFVIVAVVVVVIAALFMRLTRFGRRIYAVGSNAEAASIIGIRSRATMFAAFSLCGLLAGVAGVLWGIEFGTIYATSASGVSLQIIAAVVVGGVSIAGGSGTVVGAALGALFLGLINNALLLLGLPQELLQAIYGTVILVAIGFDALLQRRERRITPRAPSDDRLTRHDPRSRRAGTCQAGVVGCPAARRLRALRWETLLLVVIALLVVLGTRLSTVFLTGANFANLASAVMEVAIIALPMTLIIITGDIDLSVESMMGLAGAILGWLWAAGVPLQLGIPVVLAVGMLGGLLNGALIARGRLPALVVTLGTLALFRGLANVVLGTRAISNFPAPFTAFGFGNIPGTPIPWTLPVFAILAVVFALVLHATWIGRQVFAIGKNKDAARYSGVRVATLRTWLFVVTGLIAALAGVILAARFNSARSDNGTGLTLVIVTVVLLGGVDINGGKGTIPGVILAVFVLSVLQNALRLAGISSEYQNVAVGLLLIGSVAAPYLARQTRSLVDGAPSRRRPPAALPPPGEVVDQHP